MLCQLTDVSKRYARGRTTVHALARIDLEVAAGEFLAIQGPTGSGKTTLLQQVLGALDRPSGGEVWFEGRDVARLGEGDVTELRSRAFGFVFQSFTLIPTLTAQENVETALVPWHVAGDERRSRAEAALARVALDERTCDVIIGLLERLWRENGQTVILVTHDTCVASRASRRVWLDGGRLVLSGVGVNG